MKQPTRWVIEESQGGRTRRHEFFGTVVVGRAPHCQIVVQDPKASREHAKLWREGDDAFLEDLQSRTGTLLNGSSVKFSCSLQPGDVVRIGLATLRVRHATGPSQFISAAPRRVDGAVSAPTVLARSEPRPRSVETVAEAPQEEGLDGPPSTLASPETVARPGTPAGEEVSPKVPSSGQGFASAESSGAQTVARVGEEDRSTVGTRAFAGGRGEGETIYSDFRPRNSGDHEPGETRAVGDAKTRLYTPPEAVDLEPGSVRQGRVWSGSWFKVAGALLAVLFVVTFIVGLQSEPAGDGGWIPYNEEGQRGLFSISLPADWQRISPTNHVLLALQDLREGRPRAAIRVEFFREERLRYAGLSTILAEEEARLLASAPDGRIAKSRRMQVKVDAEAGFIRFTAPGDDLRILLVPHDDSVLRIECATSAKRAAEYAPVFGAMLDSFRLTLQQFFVDYPIPSPQEKSQALQHPEAVRKEILAELAVAEELFTLRDTHVSNAFGAVVKLRRVLTLCRSLVSPPAEIAKAERLLYEYEQYYRSLVRQTRAEMMVAQRMREWERARLLAARLMAVIGDRSRDAYQEAYRVHESLANGVPQE